MRGRIVSNRWTVAMLLGFALAACSPADDGVGPGDGGRDDGGPDVLPCFSLTDSDGDTIADQYEGMTDSDGDTTPNHLDTDSDNDGYLDADEAGTLGDFCRYPADSDGDDVIDALDEDSDNDGLSDREERERWSTDPRNPDSDGDGVTDLGETAYGSDPNDSGSSVASDDFFVILPYLEPPQNRELIFGTELQVADVYFLMDSTGSMDGTIENVTSSLSSTIVPALRAAIPDVQMGAGAFNDFPTEPYGDTGYYGGADQPYWHDQSITPDDWAVQTALNNVASRPRGSGYDLAESYVPALYLTATGEGMYEGGASIPPQSCPAVPDEPTARVGYPCFRPGALPIVIIAGDAPWHNGPDGYDPYALSVPDYYTTIDRLLAIGARVIGICARCSEGNEAWSHQAAAATDTGTVDASGRPLVAISPDGGVSTSIVDMVQTLASFTPQDVTTAKEDDTTDLYGVDATQFITAITPLRAVPPSGSSGQDDRTFFNVQPGTDVVFTVTFENTFFAPRESAAVFKATIVVLGNGVARLDSRTVIIIVPPDDNFVWIG